MPARAARLVPERTGRALEGRLAGLELPELPESQYERGIRWDEWLRKYPEAKALHCDHCLPRTK